MIGKIPNALAGRHATWRSPMDIATPKEPRWRASWTEAAPSPSSKSGTASTSSVAATAASESRTHWRRTADGRWVRTSEHTRGQIGDGLGETHTQDPVHLTDLGPPRLALRASSEVGIGCGIFFLD